MCLNLVMNWFQCHTHIILDSLRFGMSKVLSDLEGFKTVPYIVVIPSIKTHNFMCVLLLVTSCVWSRRQTTYQGDDTVIVAPDDYTRHLSRQLFNVNAFQTFASPVVSLTGEIV